MKNTTLAYLFNLLKGSGGGGGTFTKEVVEELPSNPSENVEYLISEPKVAKHKEVDRATTGETTKYWKVNVPDFMRAEVYYDENNCSVNIDIYNDTTLISSEKIPVGICDVDWVLYKFDTDLVECSEEDAQLYCLYTNESEGNGRNIVLPIGTNYEDLPNEVYYNFKEDLTSNYKIDVYSNSVILNEQKMFSLNEVGMEINNQLYRYIVSQFAIFDKVETKEEANLVLLTKKLNWIGDSEEEMQRCKIGGYVYQNIPNLIGRATYKGGKWIVNYKTYNSFVEDAFLQENVSPSLYFMDLFVRELVNQLLPKVLSTSSTTTIDDKKVFEFNSLSELIDVASTETSLIVKYIDGATGKTEFYNAVAIAKENVGGKVQFTFVLDQITYKVKYVWDGDMETFTPPTAEIVG